MMVWLVSRAEQWTPLDGILPGGGPVGGAADAGHGVDLGEGVDLEGGAAHGALAVDAWHGLEPVHGVLEALEPSLAVEHAASRERRVRLAAPALDHVAVVADDRGPVRRQAPVQRHAVAVPAQRGEHGAGAVVEDDEGEGAREVLDDLVGRVRPAVAERAVGLDDQQRLVGGPPAQAVLPDEAAQVVEATQEDAVDVVQAAEHPRVGAGAGAGGGGGADAGERGAAAEGGGDGVGGADAGERGAAAEGGGDGVGGVRGVEVAQDLVGVPGLVGRRAAAGAVELLRRVRHLLLEDGQHILSLLVLLCLCVKWSAGSEWNGIGNAM